MTTAALPLLEPAPAPRRALGALTVERQGERAPLPLAGVAVTATVAEAVAQVTVEQRFHNPFADPLEAVYVFPLPGGAAVSDFELVVAGRTLRGDVREREAARQRYRQALAAGHRAALLEQERDDVFTVQVGNLPPGEEVTVRLVYCERLPLGDDGRCELRLPMVVAPRYVPGEPLDGAPSGHGAGEDTDLVPDASRITPPRLAPGFDPKVALAIAVRLVDAGGEGGWDELACSQHATRTVLDAGALVVRLGRADEALDRDFVLRWRAGGREVRTTLLVHGAGRDGDASAAGAEKARPAEAGYALLTLVPPAREGFLGLPRDVVFVFDRSGSMEGEKLVAAARACSLLLATLSPRDRFAVLAFDDRLEWMGPDGHGDDAASERRRAPRLAAADEAGVDRAQRYLRGIAARGGTELDMAVEAALGVVAERADADGRAAVLVVLTDGQIADEHRVLRRLQAALGDCRVFTVGIDTAVNAAFLGRLAALGGGTASFVEPGSAAVEEALVAVAREIGSPLVVDLAITDVDAGVVAGSVTPSRFPDLFAGRAATALLRVRRNGRLRVTGRYADGVPFAEEVGARPLDLPALGHLWARSRVRDLEDAFRVAPAAAAQAALRQEIVDLAVAHRIVTRFTAYVVVDEESTIERADERRTVVQPVATPAGWAAAPPPFAARAAAPGFLPAPPDEDEEGDDFCLMDRMIEEPQELLAPEDEIAIDVAAEDDEEALSGAPGAAPPAPASWAPAMAPPPATQVRQGAGFGADDATALPPGPGESFPGWLGGDDFSAELAAAAAEQERRAAVERADAARRAAEASARQRQRVAAALAELARLLAEAAAATARGEVPAAAPLAAARSELLAALAGWDAAARAAALQRFARAAALEIVAACGSAVADAGQVASLLARHRRAFEAAQREAVALLDASPPLPPWQQTV